MLRVCYELYSAAIELAQQSLLSLWKQEAGKSPDDELLECAICSGGVRGKPASLVAKDLCLSRFTLRKHLLHLTGTVVLMYVSSISLHKGVYLRFGVSGCQGTLHIMTKLIIEHVLIL